MRRRIASRIQQQDRRPDSSTATEQADAFLESELDSLEHWCDAERVLSALRGWIRANGLPFRLRDRELIGALGEVPKEMQAALHELEELAGAGSPGHEPEGGAPGIARQAMGARAGGRPAGSRRVARAGGRGPVGNDSPEGTAARYPDGRARRRMKSAKLGIPISQTPGVASQITPRSRRSFSSETSSPGERTPGRRSPPGAPADPIGPGTRRARRSASRAAPAPGRSSASTPLRSVPSRSARPRGRHAATPCRAASDPIPAAPDSARRSPGGAPQQLDENTGSPCDSAASSSAASPLIGHPDLRAGSASAVIVSGRRSRPTGSCRKPRSL